MKKLLGVLILFCGGVAWADIAITQGAGTTIATDAPGSVNYQKIKLCNGDTSGTNCQTVKATGALVDLSSTSLTPTGFYGSTVAVVNQTGNNLNVNVAAGSIANTGFNVNNTPNVNVLVSTLMPTGVAASTVAVINQAGNNLNVNIAAGSIANTGFNVNNTPNVNVVVSTLMPTGVAASTVAVINQNGNNLNVNVAAGSIANTGFNVNNTPNVNVQVSTLMPTGVAASTVAVINQLGNNLNVAQANYANLNTSVYQSSSVMATGAYQGILITTNSVVVSSAAFGYTDVAFTVYPGTTAVGITAMTTIFEVSPDSGTYWFPLVARQMGTDVWGSSFTLTGTTTTWTGNLFGATHFRVRAGNFQVGVASVTIVLGTSQGPRYLGASLAVQNIVNGLSVPVAVGYQAGGSSVPVSVLNTVQVSQSGTRWSVAFSTTSTTAVLTSTGITTNLAISTPVAGVASQTVRVYRLLLTVDAATNITFRDGTTNFGETYYLTANGSITLDPTDEPWYITSSSNGFVIKQSGTANIGVRIWSTQS